MKAWWVKDSIYTDWGMYIHAGTRGKAKSRARAVTPAPESFEVWQDIVAWRVPAMDDKAFTYANLDAAGITQVDEFGDPIVVKYSFEVWLECGCDLCLAAART
jgi:hypothetical protein